MQTTFLTVGIACLIAAIAGGGLKAFGLEIPVLNSVPRQLVLGVLGAAFVAVSIWLIPIPPPKIGIALPKEGEKVDHKIIVHGTISGRLPARLKYLWGAVTPVSGDYQAKEEWWPQSRITPVGEAWDIAFEIGDETKDIGKDKEYLLAVFLLTSEANDSFWKYKNAWDPNNPVPCQLNEFLQKGQVQTCRIIKVIRK
jgi:hypothetical protein